PRPHKFPRPPHNAPPLAAGRPVPSSPSPPRRLQRHAREQFSSAPPPSSWPQSPTPAPPAAPVELEEFPPHFAAVAPASRPFPRELAPAIEAPPHRLAHSGCGMLHRTSSSVP